jgi:hypothetical protein
MKNFLAFVKYFSAAGIGAGVVGILELDCIKECLLLIGLAALIIVLSIVLSTMVVDPDDDCYEE